MSKSPRIDYEPYKPAHLANFKPSQYDRHNLSVLRLESRSWVDNAVTFTLDGEPCAFAGVAQLDRTAHVWVIMNDEVRKYPVAVTRLAGKVLASIQALDIDKIEVEVDPEFEQARRWALAFGFKPSGESRMIWQ